MSILFFIVGNALALLVTTIVPGITFTGSWLQLLLAGLRPGGAGQRDKAKDGKPHQAPFAFRRSDKNYPAFQIEFHRCSAGFLKWSNPQFTPSKLVPAWSPPRPSHCAYPQCRATNRPVPGS